MPPRGFLIANGALVLALGLVTVLITAQIARNSQPPLNWESPPSDAPLSTESDLELGDAAPFPVSSDPFHDDHSADSEPVLSLAAESTDAESVAATQVIPVEAVSETSGEETSEFSFISPEPPSADPATSSLSSLDAESDPDSSSPAQTPQPDLLSRIEKLESELASLRSELATQPSQPGETLTTTLASLESKVSKLSTHTEALAAHEGKINSTSSRITILERQLATLQSRLADLAVHSRTSAKPAEPEGRALVRITQAPRILPGPIDGASITELPQPPTLSEVPVLETVPVLQPSPVLEIAPVLPETPTLPETTLAAEETTTLEPPKAELPADWKLEFDLSRIKGSATDRRILEHARSDGSGPFGKLAVVREQCAAGYLLAPADEFRSILEREKSVPRSLQTILKANPGELQEADLDLSGAQRGGVERMLVRWRAEEVPNDKLRLRFEIQVSETTTGVRSVKQVPAMTIRNGGTGVFIVPVEDAEDVYLLITATH